MQKTRKKERFQWPKAGPCEQDTRKTSVVRVDWVDSATERGWRTIDKLVDGPANCTSCGFLIKRTRRYVTIAASLGVYNDCLDAVNIPMDVIRRVQVIRRAPS